MNVEYVSQKVSAICWISEDRLKTSIDSKDERFWICGSYASTQNSISIWCDKSNTKENPKRSNIFQLKNFRQPVDSDVVTIVNYDNRSSLVSLFNNEVLWLGYARDKGFNINQKWTSEELFDHQSSNLLVSDLAEFVSCGLDGKLYFINLNSKKITRTPCLTSNSMHCMDKVSDNEIIIGTTSGNIKLFDKRSQKVEMNLSNDQLSIITSIKRNSHIAHIVACGNDFGLLNIWDLRNNLHPAMQPVSVHTAMINNLLYLQNDPNVLITSSIDGQLLKWSIINGFEVDSVESIVDTKNNSYPINCFDVNRENQLIFSADNEILYLTQL